MAQVMKFFATLADEVGLLHLIRSPRDTKVLLLQRLVRFLGYGSTTLILVLFLRALDVDETRIGLFMTLTLFGDVLISLVLTIIADGFGRRKMLALGAALMTVSGCVFAVSSSYWVLLAAAILGVISPNGNEIGPFRAIEESTLAHLTMRDERTGVLAWYGVAGYTGASLGVLLCGWMTRGVQDGWGWSALDSYRLVFWAYAVFGAVKLLLCLLLTSRCEPELVAVSQAVVASEDETQPLLSNGATVPNGGQAGAEAAQEGKQEKPSLLTRLLPKLSKESASLVWKLCLLFAMDSIASGLTPASWTTYFFHQKFHMNEGRLGTLFFVANVLSTFSNFAAAPLARRIGLIKTMVFTHVPASIALALIPIPSNVVIAVALLAFRYSTNSMDQAPRQAFLAAAVLPGERTAVMGTVNVVKTLSQSVGPVITGLLVRKSLFWVAFIMAGSLKLLYDVFMLAMFLGHRTVEEQAEQTPEPEDHDEEAGSTSAPSVQR